MALSPAEGPADRRPPSGSMRLAVLARPRLPRWPGWQHLPRETRDTLFLLGVIAWVVAPHLLHLPGWCTLLVAGVMAWRAGLALSGAPLPGRLPVAAALALATGLTWWGERTLLGREAGVTMLVVLMALKTLELRARRDAMVALLLGFFLVLTQFLRSQSLATAAGTALAVWGLLTALALAHMPAGRPPLRRAAAVAGRTALVAAPLMLLLFVFFPRIGPLWGLPQDAVGRTGLSGSLRMGGLAQLAQDDSVAIRLRFPDGAPPPQALYFRGPVLANFDGREWTRAERLPDRLGGGFERVELQLLGEPVRYEATFEPSRLSMLPLLELTPERPAESPVLDALGAAQRTDLSWTLEQPLNERLRLQARAWPEYRQRARTDPWALRTYVELPPGFNPRTLEWAAELRRTPQLAQAGPAELAAVVLRRIREGGYSYTLEPGPYGAQAVDEFWFDRRMGFCEHFATAFVVAMRALDVPARVVTGYQGTDPVPVDGYWVVRQSHAHAWAEYWDPARGWVRADPTAEVAPDRIVRSRNLAAPQGFVQTTMQQISPALVARLRAAWEALDNRWNQAVLNYSRGRQFELLRSLGVESPGWEDLLRILGGLAVAAGLAGTAWAWLEQRRTDPWTRLQQRVQQRLGGLGVAVRASDPPRTRARLARAALGPAAEGLAAALEALERARYGPSAPGVPRRWWRDFEAAAQRAGRERT